MVGWLKSLYNCLYQELLNTSKQPFVFYPYVLGLMFRLMIPGTFRLPHDHYHRHSNMPEMPVISLTQTDEPTQILMICRVRR